MTELPESFITAADRLDCAARSVACALPCQMTNAAAELEAARFAFLDELMQIVLNRTKPATPSE